MHFVLKKSHDIFQHKIHEIVAAGKWKIDLVILVDIVIYSTVLEAHIGHIRRTFIDTHELRRRYLDVNKMQILHRHD